MRRIALKSQAYYSWLCYFKEISTGNTAALGDYVMDNGSFGRRIAVIDSSDLEREDTARNAIASLELGNYVAGF